MKFNIAQVVSSAIQSNFLVPDHAHNWAWVEVGIPYSSGRFACIIPADGDPVFTGVGDGAPLAVVQQLLDFVKSHAIPEEPSVTFEVEVKATSELKVS